MSIVIARALITLGIATKADDVVSHLKLVGEKASGDILSSYSRI